jgi:hypothetical protein
MPETKSKAKKRDSLTDQIGETKALSTLENPPKEYDMSDKERHELINRQKKLGRPSKYTDELATEICERIINGESLNKITKDAHMPDVRQVYRWLNSKESFRQQYAHAKEDQADTYADEIVAIADEQPELIPIYDKDGKLIEVKVDTAFIAWQKNRIDARKWTSSKLKPKKWGERQIISGDAENPLEVKQSSDMLNAILLNMQFIKQGKK